MKLFLHTIFIFSLLFCIEDVSAQQGFNDGPLIKGFGRHAEVQMTEPLPKDAKFKVAFDVSGTSGPGTLNRKFDSLARFLNMQVANGIAANNIQLALVVHGKASFDLLNAKHYFAKFDLSNPNLPLLKALLNNNVEIYLCGQSAAYHGIENNQLYEGVKMSLSAMTANAQLSQRGFSHNPF